MPDDDTTAIFRRSWGLYDFITERNYMFHREIYGEVARLLLQRAQNGGYRLLDLLTFFTVGPKEARAWTVRRGAKAPEAAGAIHTDFQRGFIRAETIAYTDFEACNGENGAKEAGKMRVEGAEYPVKDGDVFHFRFNV